jgi:hypothetical protein
VRAWRGSGDWVLLVVEMRVVRAEGLGASIVELDIFRVLYRLPSVDKLIKSWC